MDIDRFKKLQVVITEELKLTEENIERMSIQQPNIYQKYLEIYVNELQELKKMEIERETEYGKLYKHFKHSCNYEWSQKLEIESQINRDSAYNTKRLKINQQEYMVKYLENILLSIKQISFSIKNWIEIKKFKAGMF